MNTGKFILVMLIIAGCTTDPDLYWNHSTMDSEFQDLPGYSESGCNTFGAYINNNVFKSVPMFSPIRTFLADTFLQMEIWGHTITNTDTIKTGLIFRIPFHEDRSEKYLLTLENVTIDLSDSTAETFIVTNSDTATVNVSQGSIYFKRIQMFTLNFSVAETIFSGEFNYTGLINDQSIIVENGRFDLAVHSLPDMDHH